MGLTLRLADADGALPTDGLDGFHRKIRGQKQQKSHEGSFVGWEIEGFVVFVRR
jgi:hypothetical protein